ncbi:MAG: hypothetical protein ACD_26C00102G0001 [uncultured bacterium]|nr:MAG: hypothetical protein ACD_26C00102G0001 [uncultured bacterium]
MYYSISEASKQLKVSKVTIYKKLDKINELKEHVKQLKDGKCITQEGIGIIRKSLELNQLNKHLQVELKGDVENTDVRIDLIVYKQLIETLEKQVNDLKGDKENLYHQLKIKDDQISCITDALGISQKLNENNQVLLNQAQQKVFLIESTEQNEKFNKPWWKRFINK